MSIPCIFPGRRKGLGLINNIISLLAESVMGDNTHDSARPTRLIGLQGVEVTPGHPLLQHSPERSEEFRRRSSRL